MHKFGWKSHCSPEVGKYVLLLLSDGSVVMGVYAGPHDGYKVHDSFVFDDPKNLRVHGWQYLPNGVPEFK